MYIEYKRKKDIGQCMSCGGSLELVTKYLVNYPDDKVPVGQPCQWIECPNCHKSTVVDRY